MKNFLTVISFIACVFAPALGAEDFEQLIQDGVKLHDAGKYREAIEQYDKALKINPKSCMAIYEKVFSLWSAKETDEAIKTGEAVAQTDCKKHTNLRMLLASAYDDRGENAKAVALLKGLVQEAPNNHFMHYNLAISLSRAGLNKEAEQSLQAALRLEPRHFSSHYALGRILYASNQRAKAMLCYYMALLIEPAGKRSAEIMRYIDEYYAGLATEKNDKEITLNVASAGDGDSAAFSDLTIGMGAALAKSKKKNRDEAFADITLAYLQILAELRPKNNGFYWSQYVDFFSALKAAKHDAAFVRVIQVSSSETARSWIDANKEKALMLQEWLKARLTKP